jgi:P-type Mg2+ transporter
VKRLAAIHDLGAMDVLCTDKTGTLTEAKIRLMGHVDASGNDDEEVFRLAYLNSAFESGIKSPLDDAILAHRELDVKAWHKIDEVPFDFERRRLSVLIDDGTTRLLVVKGAPEDLIQLSVEYQQADGRCRPLDDQERHNLLQMFERFGEDGYRVLGVASREMGSTATPWSATRPS